MLAVVAALWGGAAGLLVPRAAYRLSVEPEEAWRDACPAGHPIGGPVRGWVGLARCRECARATTGPLAPPPGPAVVRSDHPRPAAGHGDPGPVVAQSDPADPDAPGPRYRRAPVLPLTTALLCALLALATGPRPEVAVWLLCAPVGVLLAVVDRAVHRLPDGLTLPLAGGAAALLGLAALLPGAAGSWPGALLGGLVLGGAYFVLFLVNPNGMGFGDVKLALALGVFLGWYGWTVLFAGAFAGFLLGAVYGLGLMALGRAGRRTAIPFGPFMLAGAYLGLLAGALGAS
ncbi:A24 family peptidase [Streptomyces sp. NPDC005805]|uniref:A24 family peptidase n=1 Tax=Streptomyces sp. NPDC005805 TaxID=3157068 RepID=UPI0033E6B5A0